MNIGNLNFGVDAQTVGLRKAVAELEKFRTKVNQVAASQQEGAQKAATAMSKQESAIKRGLQQVLKLRQELQRTGAEPEQLARVSNAFRKLTAEMTSGKLSSIEFTRAMDAFNTRMGRVRRTMADLKAEEASHKFNKLTKTIRDLESASVLTVGPLSGLGARIRAIAAITSRSSLALAAFFGVITGGIVLLSKITKAAFDTGRSFESLEAILYNATGSMSRAKEEMEFIIVASRTLGLRIQNTATAFARLTAATQGTQLEGEGARAVFLGIARAAASLRMRGADVEATFRAVEQMISKGTVSAQELRSQLGDRLPGAFRIAAESMGVTTRELSKMLQQGKLTSEMFLTQFIPALEKALGAGAADNANQLEGSIANLATEFTLFARNVDQVIGVSRAVQRALFGMTRTLEWMRLNMLQTLRAAAALAIGLSALALPALFAAFMKIGSAFAFIAGTAVKAARGVITLTQAVLALNVAMMANPAGRLLAILGKLALVVGTTVAAWFGLKYVMDDTVISLEDLNKSLDDFDFTMPKVTEEVEEAENAFTRFMDSVKQTAREIRQFSNAIAEWQSTGARPALILETFKAIDEMVDFSTAELHKLRNELEETLGRRISIDWLSDDPMGDFRRAMGEGIAEARLMGVDLSEEFRAIEEGIRNAAQATQNFTARFGDLRTEVEYLRRGPEAFEEFRQIIAPAQQFLDILRESNIPLAQQEILAARVNDLFRERNQLSKEHAEAQRAARQAEREEERRQQRLAELMQSTSDSIDVMQRKLELFHKGPEALRQFEEIELPIARLRREFELLGLEAGKINEIMDRYREVLEQTKRANDLMGGAARQTANVIGNALEDIIMKTQSVEEGLKNLARELLRVFVRAQFLDPLVNAMTGGFGNMFNNATGGNTGIPKGATGLRFTVPGSGGTDNQLVRFMAKPGEEVVVRRPDQPGAGGGGGTTVVINAPGADAGTIARLREIGQTELLPQAVRGATRGTITALRRPRFA